MSSVVQLYVLRDTKTTHAHRVSLHSGSSRRHARRQVQGCGTCAHMYTRMLAGWLGVAPMCVATIQP